MPPINWNTFSGELSFLFVGVGGQGIILASDILAGVGLKLGLDVKKAEIHGMSQRGGSVLSQVRWGAKVFSPIIGKGGGDIMIAFEKLEALRFCDYLKKNARVLLNDGAILPISVIQGEASYPTNTQIVEALSSVTRNVVWVNGSRLAEQLGNPRLTNMILLGALSQWLGLPDEVVLEAITERVPETYLAQNREAYFLGNHLPINQM